MAQKLDASLVPPATLLLKELYGENHEVYSQNINLIRDIYSPNPTRACYAVDKLLSKGLTDIVLLATRIQGDASGLLTHFENRTSDSGLSTYQERRCTDLPPTDYSKTCVGTRPDIK